MKLVYGDSKNKKVIPQLKYIIVLSFIITLLSSFINVSSKKNSYDNKILNKYNLSKILNTNTNLKKQGQDFLDFAMSISSNTNKNNDALENSESSLSFLQSSMSSISNTNRRTMKTKVKNKIKELKSILHNLNRYSPQTSTRISDISKIKKNRNSSDNEYLQYKYYDFDEIKDELFKLAKVENGNWVKITTAQEEFNLPNPGGYCGKNKE